MASYDYDFEIKKIKEAFDRVKDDMDSILAKVSLHERNDEHLEESILKLDKEIGKLAEKHDKFESKAKIENVLDKLKMLSENQKMQEKEITKLKKIIEKNSNVISTNSEKILKNTVSSVNNDVKRILVNKRSMKVHYSNCPYVRNTRLENLEEYKELKQALKDGYVRCQCIFNH